MIPQPPIVPCSDWLSGFARTLIALRPGLAHDNAVRCAVLAHPQAWLLEPEEAARLWVAAIEATARDALHLPRGLLS